MTKPPTAQAIGLGFCGALLVVNAASAQMPLPAARPVEGLHYSPGFGRPDFIWDDAKLDAWLANPREIIPGAVMAYWQTRPETRAAIIVCLKGLN